LGHELFVARKDFLHFWSS